MLKLTKNCIWRAEVSRSTPTASTTCAENYIGVVATILKAKIRTTTKATTKATASTASSSAHFVLCEKGKEKKEGEEIIATAT